MALNQKEGEQQKPAPQMWTVAQKHQPLSGSVWLCLALTFVDSQDAFCTKDFVAPRNNNSTQSDNVEIVFPFFYTHLKPVAFGLQRKKIFSPQLT